jgi:hypothetical protein
MCDGGGSECYCVRFPDAPDFAAMRIEGWPVRLWLYYRWGRFLGWLDGWRR